MVATNSFNLFSSRLPCKKLEIKTYENIILLLFRMGVKLGLTPREEHRLRVFEKRALRLFGYEEEEVAGGYKMRNFINCKRHQILFG